MSMKEKLTSKIGKKQLVEVTGQARQNDKNHPVELEDSNSVSEEFKSEPT